MIKRISLLTRKPEMSRKDFNKYWLEVHGPMVRTLPNVRQYIQNHIVDDAHRHDLPTGGQAVDGIVEFWFDNVEDMDACFATPEAKACFADGAKFIETVTTYVIEEHKVIPDIAGTM